MRFPVVSLALLATVVLACAPPTPGGPDQDILSIIESSQELVPMRGERLVQLTTTAGVIEHREMLTTDGQGGFLLELISVNDTNAQGGTDPQVAADWPLIEALFELRSPYYWRYRDFRIRDVGLLLQNYWLSSDGLATVAGRPVWLLRSTSKTDGRVFDYAVDQATGAFLSTRVHDPVRQVTLYTEFLNVDFQPDLSGMVFHNNGTVVMPLATGSPASWTTGSVALRFRLIPAGYVLWRTEEILVPGQQVPYHVDVYSDGAETLFLVQRPIASGGLGLLHGSGTVAGIPQPPIIHAMEVGRATILSAQTEDVAVALMGTAPQGELLTVFEALH